MKTPELFLPEFRNFKFLKSQALAEHTKTCQLKFNQVRPADQVDNDQFAWSSRVEFIDQIFDLDETDIFVVEPGDFVKTADPKVNTNVGFTYEPARLYQFHKPRIIRGHPISDYEIMTTANVEEIEVHDTISNFFLVSAQGLEFGATHINFRTINLLALSLIPATFFNYTAIFYTHYEADAYRVALTSFLRKQAGSVSAISNLL